MASTQANLEPVAPAGQGSREITTSDGTQMFVRQARPLDMPAVRLFFSRLTPEDVRFRFLSGPRINDGVVEHLLSLDHLKSEHFLAFAAGHSEIVASAVVAIGPDDKAEVALCTHPEFKHRGVSWALLEIATEWARRHGATAIMSLELRDHREAVAMEREQGFVAVEAGDPAVVTLEKPLSKWSSS